MLNFSFDNTYVRDLSGFYTAWQPEPRENPELLYLNLALVEQLGLDLAAFSEAELADIFTGKQLPEGAEPIAQAYAGHQFGHFNPQLGDGRALILGEVIDRQGKRFDIGFKGSGRTPFSRGGDGKAALGPMLREVLIGEAMHALGVATTRSLAVTGTGERIFREQQQPGAVLTRVAASHIRIGTFQYFSAQGKHDEVKRLADYSIARHDPELAAAQNPYLEFLRAVAQRQAELVAQWMSLGFIHGVMNTDNVSIAGETIDYGPCAFMESYDPNAVFSSIDEHGRYAYQNQPKIAQWNLARFAETLLPLFSEDQQEAVDMANQVVQSFPDTYQQYWLVRMCAKLGLEANERSRESDKALIESWLELLQAQKVDFTLAWRLLAGAAEDQTTELRKLFSDVGALDNWLEGWQLRCDEQDCNEAAVESERPGKQRAEAMRAINPRLIPRNHHVEEALSAASDKGDLEPFEKLLSALERPYDEDAKYDKFAEPADPEFTAWYQTFCGT